MICDCGTSGNPPSELLSNVRNSRRAFFNYTFSRGNAKSLLAPQRQPWRANSLSLPLRAT